MESIPYKVPGIHCHHCVHTIKMELIDLEGVTQVDVDGVTKSVSVQFQPPATALKIEQLLEEINYPAEKN